MRRTAALTIFSILIALTFVGLTTAPLHAQAGPDAMRRYYLEELIGPHDYVPGKNSFLIQRMHRGERKTLLDLSGGGSVRHVWSTWSIPGDDSDVPAPRRVLMRVFVDGQILPSIVGPLDELCRAAEATGSNFVPLAAFNYKGAFNFYLPIFFNRGIRIEIEAVDEIQEFYAQIDYRTGYERHAARLVSEANGGSLGLRYVGGRVSWTSAHTASHRVIEGDQALDYSDQPAQMFIQGPGVVRELTFKGDSLDDVQLQIYWDDHRKADIDAPLKYFFADFKNAAMQFAPGESACYFPMPFRKRARIVLRSVSGRRGHVTVQYLFEPHALPVETLYFHAQYHETEKTLGYEQYSVLQTHGEGVFVGMNLFDSGHNHGGGDAALIDAGTTNPRVLHGICGEDYFGFAWHHFGTMTLLTGAPAHERRYRLHLENPYPFHESLQVLFGVFADQHPKSVAFWYQSPGSEESTLWRTCDIPWKVLGPVNVEAQLTKTLSKEPVTTLVPINEPTELRESWQDAHMRSGFIDATYEFRHFAMTQRGTGFVAGASKTEMITWVYSSSQRKVRAILGHDDRVSITLNDGEQMEVPPWRGFGPAAIELPLRRGWNRLGLIVYNDENENWRWCGVSLAFDREQGRDLRFASQPDLAHAAP